MLNHWVGELRKVLIDNTNILEIIIAIIGTENNNNISASFSQVGIVCACGATRPKPELCHSFIAFLYCMIGLKELLSHTGPSSSIKDCYNLICHITE